MNTVTKRIAGLLLVSVMALGVAACAKNEGPQPNYGQPGADVTGTVTASGSTALLPLAQLAAEQFQAKNPKVQVNVSGGGSFNGLNQVAEGAVQIGNSDVVAPAEQYGAKGLVDHQVAVMPFIIITSKDVKVTDLSLDQLAKIFRGEIKNWKEVGGADAKITVISRQASSGSRATIIATVLKGQGDITKDAIVQDSNGKIRDSLPTTPNAISYVDAPYFNAATMNKLKVGGVEYSAENVLNGKYPIFAYGHMYTKGEPTGATKAFLEFVLSKEFQESQLEPIGFLPVSKLKK